MTKDPQTLHRFLTAALLCDALRSAGYRVTETKGADGAPVLVSATSGMSFEVRLLNPLTHGRKGTPAGAASEDAIPADAYADAAFRAAFRIQGELPLALVNHWNVTHRFARLHIAGEWLLMEMDVIVLGGVLADNLRAHLEIWDRLIPELIAYLREELPKLARPAPQAEPAATDAPAEAVPDSAA